MNEFERDKRHLPLLGSMPADTSGKAAPGPPFLPLPIPVPIGGSESADSLEPGDDSLLQVGDLAKLCGKTVRAIHLYEELGLVRPHARSKGRYRLFSSDAVVRVRWIGKLQDLGLSLATIQSIVREWEASPSAPGAMAKMREIYRQKLASARAQIARLAALEAELAASLEYLETCDACDPARLIPACTCCDRHDEREAPELVAGFRQHSVSTNTQ
jgi:MerR family transcriptional regulator, copper efflux regulator